MNAAVLHEFKRPLTLREVDPPKPGETEVLIAVEACGVCHSDLHVADGDWPQFARIVKKPLILGHEIAGRVVEKGSAVRDLHVGDCVGVPWLHWTCGDCEFCREGNENLCARQKITGVTVDGGYAEFVKAPASHALKIPEGLSSVEAAPLFCAGVTVFRALKQARISRGQRLAVFGIGGLGHIAVQIGCALGAEVTAVDISEEKLALAKSLGARHALHAASPDVAKEFRNRGGVHAALVTSAAKEAYDMAFSCVRPSGYLLVVGLPAENICFPPILLAAREVRMQATAVGTRQDLSEILAMAAAGKVRCQTATRPLAHANQVLEELRQGSVSGRIVLTPHGSVPSH
ncbi:MAG TPA: alcohol dehydrogenase catalytic domain-containing protein [Candidatus Acidoferrales bacterium]|jgi:propanol-preferring alcohol dehydrogenase|nr:alcohol dehydrogenase catalytic domain-containing protein [Candidatus Acidoferrales bacterium]